MRLKKVLVATAAAAAIVVGVAGPALAATSEVGGGTWSHGTTGLTGGGTVYSNYKHAGKCHGSSVKNANGEWDYSGDVSAGRWSYASINAVPFKTDFSYWRNSC